MLGQGLPVALLWRSYNPEYSAQSLWFCSGSSPWADWLCHTKTSLPRCSAVCNINCKGKNQYFVIEQLLDELPVAHHVVCIMIFPRWSVHFLFLSAPEILQGFVSLTIRGKGPGSGVKSSNVEISDNTVGEIVSIRVVAVKSHL